MKILTVIGARPQLIKAAAVSRAIARAKGVEECILHTGQHYDAEMNGVFLRQLGISPDWQLQCGGLAAPEMTARMMDGISKAVRSCRPDCLLVYGDTTSTLAGALTASQLRLPLVHVEAGLRSFNRQMPEELNRVVADHAASLLFCPTAAAVSNLAAEHITEGVHLVGDIMYDAALEGERVATSRSSVMQRISLRSKHFLLCTIHRAENTDSPDRLTDLIRAVTTIASNDRPVVWPLHPRTRKCIEAYGLTLLLEATRAVRIIPPVDYFDMLMLEKHAQVILTDSGGMQKEAYFLRTPCVTLRQETEWVETVAAGWNQLAGHKAEDVIRAVENAREGHALIDDYGDGHAANRIVDIIQHHGL